VEPEHACRKCDAFIDSASRAGGFPICRVCFLGLPAPRRFAVLSLHAPEMVRTLGLWLLLFLPTFVGLALLVGLARSGEPIVGPARVVLIALFGWFPIACVVALVLQHKRLLPRRLRILHEGVLARSGLPLAGLEAERLLVLAREGQGPTDLAVLLVGEGGLLVVGLERIRVAIDRDALQLAEGGKGWGILHASYQTLRVVDFEGTECTVMAHPDDFPDKANRALQALMARIGSWDDDPPREELA
jgi:hypothetical protein